jgi:hypothetical protein
MYFVADLPFRKDQVEDIKPCVRIVLQNLVIKEPVFNPRLTLQFSKSRPSNLIDESNTCSAMFSNS